jgi:hypothetical protein
MSLLTKKQIAELACIASNQSTSKDLYEEFCEWNKNQHPFNVNWDDAPDHAKIASIRIHWLTEINAGWSTTTEIISFDRPIVAHPHAEMIMKYAEVAARRVDPWVEFEWADIRVAYSWQKMTCTPDFDLAEKYRHIGETK